MESIFKICIRTIFLIEDKKSIKAINCGKKGWRISWVIGNTLEKLVTRFLCTYAALADKQRK